MEKNISEKAYDVCIASDSERDAKLEGFRRDVKETLEFTKMFHNLEETTLADYILLAKAIHKMDEDLKRCFGNRRIIIPRKYSEITIKNEMYDCINYIRESPELKSIKENGFTDQEIIAIVWCAASLVLHPLIMDDEELDRLMAGETTLNTQGENPTLMNT
jgi:hypothetical protein